MSIHHLVNRQSRSIPQASFQTDQYDSVKNDIDNITILNRNSFTKLYLNSAWVELMLARNEFNNYSNPFQLVTEELNESQNENFQLLSLNADEKELIHVCLNNRKMRITFGDL